MKIGIVGLGLIGGSLAKAYHATGHEVYAYDLDHAIMEFAAVDGVVDHVLDENAMQACEAVLLAIPPMACIEYLTRMSPYMAPSAIVMDMSGIKRAVCDKGFALAKQYGYTFVGGHPMAGTQFSGYKYADGDLFRGAPMVIVPPVYDDIRLYERIKKTLAPMGFGKFSYTTADRHDELIAFTSQLAHVVSNAYVKSPTAKNHNGFSAGSYRDLTRVAWLNEAMWTELFLANKDHLIREIDTIIASLLQYKTALAQEDGEVLLSLLREGRIAKEEIDGNELN